MLFKFLKKCQLCRGTITTDEDISMPQATQRENMATWFRHNIAVTDVYEILKNLGQGRMGEVYHVRRRDGGRTHTVASKKKAEEVAAAEALVEDFDDLNTSMRSLRGLLQNSKSGENNSMGGGSVSSMERSFRSPFKRSNSKKKNDAIVDGFFIPNEDEKRKKTPPDLTKVPKPNGILRKPSHGQGPVNRKEADQVESLPGISALIMNAMDCDSDIDDDEEDVDVDDENSMPNNITISKDPSLALKLLKKKETPEIEVVHHPKFCTPDQDDSSIISEVTEAEAEAEVQVKPSISNRDSVVTGDDYPDDDITKKKGKTVPKKWVPRRRVFFRRHYACKTIATENIKKAQMEELYNEIYMMRKMDHPYIIRLYEVYQVENKMWLVMDLCTGGDLNSRKLNEQQVTVVAEQILRGVAYLHQRGICHRDLKMENILYESNEANSSIRLIDFGLSYTYDTIDTKQKFMGAAYTLSPEVLAKKSYTNKSDIWSIGVIIWKILSGDFPFIKQYEDLKKDELKKKLQQADYFFGITWKGRGLTQEARKFVQGCLKRDPDDRWSALDALTYMQDTWIPVLEEREAEEQARYNESNTDKKVNLKHKKIAEMYYTKLKMAPPSTISGKRRKHGLNLLDESVLNDIKRFAKYSLLKKTIFVTMANTMDAKDVGEVRELFLMIDTNQTGTITLSEFKNVLCEIDSNDMNDEQIEQVFKAIDYDRTGEIHYAEFLASLIESQSLNTLDRLEDTFDRIDRHGKGVISRDDLRHILGENYTEEAVDEMIEECDFKKNGVVDFEEFQQAMTGELQRKNSVENLEDKSL